MYVKRHEKSYKECLSGLLKEIVCFEDAINYIPATQLITLANIVGICIGYMTGTNFAIGLMLLTKVSSHTSVGNHFGAKIVLNFSGGGNDKIQIPIFILWLI